MPRSSNVGYIRSKDPARSKSEQVSNEKTALLFSTPRSLRASKGASFSKMTRHGYKKKGPLQIRTVVFKD